MVNQISCDCPFVYFVVSDIYATSANSGQLYFTVDAVCTKCAQSVPVAMHTNDPINSAEMFREHHEMMKEFYEDLE